MSPEAQARSRWRRRCLPPRGPGQPDPGGFRLAVGLYPERNEEAPSAHHVFEAGIVECGPGAAKGTQGDLCIG